MHFWDLDFLEEKKDLLNTNTVDLFHMSPPLTLLDRGLNNKQTDKQLNKLQNNKMKRHGTTNYHVVINESLSLISVFTKQIQL